MGPVHCRKGIITGMPNSQTVPKAQETVHRPCVCFQHRIQRGTVETNDIRLEKRVTNEAGGVLVFC